MRLQILVLLGLLAFALFHSRFAGEFYATFVIGPQDFDPDFVTHLNEIGHLFHADIGQFAHVTKTFASWLEFHKTAEVTDRCYLAPENSADFNGRCFGVV